MPELIDRQAALRLCKDADWEDDRIFIAGYNHAIRTMTQAITELPTIEPEVRLIPKEVSATDIDKLTEMIKDSLLQAYPNDVMFTAVRHGRWIEIPPYADETVKGLEFQIVCSRCAEQNSSITFDENSVPIAKTFYRTRFCPNCGAKMDATDTNVGGKEDEEMDLSPLDFLAAEYDRKHPQGIRFVDCMEGADDGACKKV